MNKEDKIAISLIGLLTVGWLVTSVTAQQEHTGPINATISQPISIELSDALRTGIFFTNGTQVGIQFPITNMTHDNNATHNYACVGGSTCYNIMAGSGNTINVSIFLSACNPLRNGTNIINLHWDAGDGGQGAFFANGTSATAPTLSPTEGFAFRVDNYTMIFANSAPGNITHYRFWLDPWPNHAPSGIYNTTYKIRAVEIGTGPGSGEC